MSLFKCNSHCVTPLRRNSLCVFQLSQCKNKSTNLSASLSTTLVFLTELCIKFLLLSLPSYTCFPGIFDSVKTCCITGSLQLFFSLKTCFPQIYVWIILSFPSKFYSKLFIIVDLYKIVVTPNHALYGISVLNQTYCHLCNNHSSGGHIFVCFVHHLSLRAVSGT